MSLAISYKFIRLMGGDIQVRSAIQEGTIVTFDIPVRGLNPETITLQDFPQDAALQTAEPSLSQDSQDSPEVPLSADALKYVPHDILDDLQEAAEMLDLKALRTLITRIREHDAALADALTHLAETYQFDVMSESVQHVKAAHTKS